MSTIKTTDSLIDQRNIDTLEEMLKHARSGNLDAYFLFYTLMEDRTNDEMSAPEWGKTNTCTGGEILAVHSMCHVLGHMIYPVLGTTIQRIEDITGGFANQDVTGTVN